MVHIDLCHHQIIYFKLNLTIKYPFPYQRLVWDYKRADMESIKRSIELVNWVTLFHNKSLHQQKLDMMNEHIAFNGEKLKRSGLVHACFTIDGIVRVKKSENSKPLKVFYRKLARIIP